MSCELSNWTQRLDFHLTYSSRTTTRDAVFRHALQAYVMLIFFRGFILLEYPRYISCRIYDHYALAVNERYMRAAKEVWYILISFTELRKKASML